MQVHTTIVAPVGIEALQQRGEVRYGHETEIGMVPIVVNALSAGRIDGQV